jgi:hypothetical protein
MNNRIKLIKITRESGDYFLLTPVEHDHRDNEFIILDKYPITVIYDMETFQSFLRHLWDREKNSDL